MGAGTNAVATFDVLMNPITLPSPEGAQLEAVCLHLSAE